MHFLKYSILCSLLFFISCDDGDIVISDFEFDIDNMDFCYDFNDEDEDGSIEKTVFFNINTANDEVLFTVIDDDIDLENEESFSFNVTTSSNIVSYIKFDSFDSDDYFCTPIANNNQVIERELTGTDGTVNVVVTNTITDDGDEDSDGLTNEEEVYNEDFLKTDDNSIHELEEADLKDSDLDGIPDFRDADDDNDNVETSEELYPKDDDGESITDGDFLDTDGDGNFDYLDSDDDDDGIATWLEFKNDGVTTFPVLNLNDDETLPLYLDPLIAVQGMVTEPIVLLNAYTTNFRTVVEASDLEFSESNSNETVTNESLFIGQINRSSQVQHQVFLSVNDDDDTFTFETFVINSDIPEGADNRLNLVTSESPIPSVPNDVEEVDGTNP